MLMAASRPNNLFLKITREPSVLHAVQSVIARILNDLVRPARLPKGDIWHYSRG